MLPKVIITTQVYLLKRSVDKKSWTPWMVSLLIDLGSRAASKGLLTPWIQRRFPGIFSPSQEGIGGISAAVPMTMLGQEEMRRRLWLLLFYLLRSPFFTHFTKDKFMSVCKSIDRMPILSIFSNILRGKISGFYHQC
jgi:peroxin-16